ncbi:hypothetical protein FOZ62_005340, partial [Perkinsus olseni]
MLILDDLHLTQVYWTFEPLKLVLQMLPCLVIASKQLTDSLLHSMLPIGIPNGLTDIEFCGCEFLDSRLGSCAQRSALVELSELEKRGISFTAESVAQIRSKAHDKPLISRIADDVQSALK